MKSLQSLNREVRVVTAIPDDLEDVEGAIVNLSKPEFRQAVTQLTANGIPVAGHAGHKEKELLELGREAGCKVLATNSELTFKLDQVLARLAG